MTFTTCNIKQQVTCTKLQCYAYRPIGLKVGPSTPVNCHNVNSMLLAYLNTNSQNVKGKLCVFCNKHINLTIQLIQRNKNKYDLPQSDYLITK